MTLKYGLIILMIVIFIAVIVTEYNNNIEEYTAMDIMYKECVRRGYYTVGTEDDRAFCLNKTEDGVLTFGEEL